MLSCVGFHGTASSNVDSIIKNGYYPSDRRGAWFGKGIYFFGDLPPMTNGVLEARSWVINVTKAGSWAIFRALIESDKYVDLLENVDHKQLYDEIKRELVNIHLAAGKREEDFKERLVFTVLQQRNKIDVVRAPVDAARQSKFASYVVRRFQVQICAISATCVKANELIEEGPGHVSIRN